MKREEAAALVKEMFLSGAVEWETWRGLRGATISLVLSAYRRGAEEMRERCVEAALGTVGKGPEGGSGASTITPLPRALAGFGFADYLRALPLTDDEQAVMATRPVEGSP